MSLNIQINEIEVEELDGPIEDRTWYHDEELNKFVLTLVEPAGWTLLPFNTVEVHMNRGKKQQRAEWNDFDLAPGTTKILLPVNFSYGRLTGVFQRGSHVPKGEKQELNWNHSSLLFIDLDTNRIHIFDTIRNKSQREFINGAIRLAIQRRLQAMGILDGNLHFGQVLLMAAKPHGCSLSACTAAWMIMMNKNVDTLERTSSGNLTGSQDFWFQKIRRMINAANI